MTDRDRLIELLYPAVADVIDNRKGLVEIADYLLANGVIVPPCKVGDVVYEVNTKYPKAPYVNRYIVVAFHITSGKNILGHKKPSHAVVSVDYLPSLSKRIYLDNFGKTVFLTKEEAEQALKELKE